MIKKGIILAAGRGTRLYPATIAIGKPLLPIFDKPMIYYSLAMLMQAGLQDICIVTNEHDLPLFQELLGDGKELGIHLSYRIQYEAKGIADVFNVAKDFIGHEPCALILGDNIFMGNAWKDRFQDIQKHPLKGAHVFAIAVDDPNRYGVLSLDDTGGVLDILEKPEHPPSNYAVTGLYFYDERAVTLAQSLKPSARGEFEITDLNRLYLQEQQLTAHILDATGEKWFDVGTHVAMHQAIDEISHYIHTTKQQVGCIEEIAYLNSWVTTEELEVLAHKVRYTPYGTYLKNLCLHERC
jgi:glucose-1-phosphate thymidylyltransferase